MNYQVDTTFAGRVVRTPEGRSISGLNARYNLPETSHQPPATSLKKPSPRQQHHPNLEVGSALRRGWFPKLSSRTKRFATSDSPRQQLHLRRFCSNTDV